MKYLLQPPTFAVGESFPFPRRTLCVAAHKRQPATRAKGRAAVRSMLFPGAHPSRPLVSSAPAALEWRCNSVTPPEW
eukprot:gene19034-biopygen11509